MFRLRRLCLNIKGLAENDIIFSTHNWYMLKASISFSSIWCFKLTNNINYPMNLTTLWGVNISKIRNRLSRVIHFFLKSMKSSYTGWKKRFHLGNIGEITWKQQVYNKFPWGFHPGNYLFPCGFPRGETPYAPVWMLPSQGNSGQLVVSLYGR